MIVENDMIIITTNNYKAELLKENKLKYNAKIYTLNEFKELYYFTYKSDVLNYLVKKYNIIPEIADIILNNLYEIENKTYSTKKLNRLVEIKNDLIENGYIIFNNNFRKFIENKKIVCYNTRFKNYPFYDIEIQSKEKIEIYKYDTIEEEVVNTAIMIKELLDNNVDINKIKINRLDGSYTGIFNRIFDYYHIPYDNKAETLYYLSDTKRFLNEVPLDTKLLDLNEILENMNLNEDVHNAIVNIINKYTSYETLGDIYDCFIYELKQKNIKLVSYDNVIKEISYKTYIPKDDEYIFILGFNQDIIPKIYKNDSYLLDKELKELNEITSFDKNEEEVKTLTNFINMTKNLVMSYKLASPKQEFGYSNYLTGFDNLIELNHKYDYKNKKYNELLLAGKLDNFILYNDKASDLEDLYSNYENINYNTYSNLYEKIDYEVIKKQLNNKINLSYSNITTFYECQFKFLLSNIYGVSKFKETVSQIIGKLFHLVLEKVYRNDRLDYDNVIDEALSEIYPEGMNKKQKFYSEKYRTLIKELIEILNENNNRSQFKGEYFEQSFRIKKDNDLDITIKGFVDKILTFNDGINTYVIVIDYKTGGMHNDFKKVVHGLDMQLLMYLYLIKNTDLIKNPKFAGMYLQQIMTDVLPKHPKKTYKEQTMENARLNGYTLKDTRVISMIDKLFEDSSFIKGLAIKKDGEFKSTAKVLTEDEINNYIDIVDKNIDNVIRAINESEFTINPKKIGNSNEGCKYCEFKDICYMNNDNIVELELGGDDDDDDKE